MLWRNIGILFLNSILEILQEKFQNISIIFAVKIRNCECHSWHVALGFKNIRASKYQEHSEYIFGAIEYQNILWFSYNYFFRRPLPEDSGKVNFHRSSYCGSTRIHVHLTFLPPDIHCLNYRLVMNTISYSRQTFLIYKSDNDTCLHCGTSLETLEHPFVKCDEVQGSHTLLIDILHNCLVNGMSANIVIPYYTQLILFDGQKKRKKEYSF